jgi:hypothetical protein
MAFGSLLLLLDDIAVLMDDVAVMTKLATKKTAGVLGDDLALNAEQVSGVVAERELPVVWAVAKGSAVNKAILVPAALLISAVYAPAIKVLLMLGGCLPLLRGLREGVGEADAPRRPSPRRGPPRKRAEARRHRGRAGAGEDQGRRAHRLHPVGGDRRDRPRQLRRQAPAQPDRGPGVLLRLDDGGGVRAGGVGRKA